MCIDIIIREVMEKRYSDEKLLLNLVFQRHLMTMNFDKITALTYPEVGEF
jgi:hypothetical protein